MDKLTEQETAVSNFLKEHRPLLKDPELSDIVLETIFIQGAELLESVSDDMTRMSKTTVDATNSLTEALNERPRIAPKIARRERKYKHYLARFERMKKAFNELESFVTEVKVRRDREEALPQSDMGSKADRALSNDCPIPPADPLPTPPDPDESSWYQPYREPSTKNLSWWKRLLGIHQEAPSELREASVTPSEIETDHRDYEKFLDYYSQVLDHLESLVEERRTYGEEYVADQDQRWKALWDKAVDGLAWADENMDAIEERNPEIVCNEPGDRRRNLQTRRTRLGG